MARLSLWLLHGLSLASAASWQHARHKAAQNLTVWLDKAAPDVPIWQLHVIKAAPQAKVACLPDLPGGRLMAGGTMAGGIMLTACLTVALMYYLIHKRADAKLVLPGPNDNVPLGDGTGSMRPAKAKPKRVYMHTLDGMRTLLVTAVIFAHYPVGLPSICKHFLGWPMQFFFVLSGFVAQQQAEGNEQFTWLSGWTYVARRLGRILPLYQLALVFQFALAVYGNRGCQPVAAWPMNALLLQVIFPVQVCGNVDGIAAWTLGYTHFNGNGPAWFAACIVWFSCLFPLLYNGRPRSGGLWMLGALVVLLCCREVPDIIHPKWGTYGGGPHLYAMSLIRLMEYTAGMWAAQLATDIGRRWSGMTCWCWVFDGAVVLLVAMIYVSLQYLGSTWTCSGDYHLTALCCFVCIAARLAAEIPEESREGLRGAVLHRVIGSFPLTYLARFSFAAYIFQTSFMSFTDGDQNFYFHRFCLLWMFSVFATIYIEEPIRLAAEARLKG